MKEYAMAVIVCGIVAGAVTILCCFYKDGRKKKDSAIARSVAVPPPQQAYHDVEKAVKNQSSGNKDGSMVILKGATAAVAATAATAAVIGASNDGGCGGGCDSGGCCGGCGGGDELSSSILSLCAILYMPAIQTTHAPLTSLHQLPDQRRKPILINRRSLKTSR